MYKIRLIYCEVFQHRAFVDEYDCATFVRCIVQQALWGLLSSNEKIKICNTIGQNCFFLYSYFDNNSIFNFQLKPQKSNIFPQLIQLTVLIFPKPRVLFHQPIHFNVNKCSDAKRYISSRST